ncbi:NifB/NifX family molybdenum-iron cluster-binding protein [Thermoanaerobacterium thermosaccharolyticum]|uniref:NifB/NifX family molybdenum-iron cluster-binding protein n=1 Tax=Thermoanaerobacterium thermosaccharolyticum TaxID=1517 RepID=UPI00279E101C|nr:NifB/NifX family molybdenum-iron cluster-binding protein [Thermoanaerobacterium thermosaccharolyticum]
MIIAFASKNHLGLNSDIGSDIVNSEYITVAEVEDGKLKKVKNVENIFYNDQKLNAKDFVDFISKTNAEIFVVMNISEEIKAELLKNNISVKLVTLGRIADILNTF